VGEAAALCGVAGSSSNFIDPGDRTNDVEMRLTTYNCNIYRFHKLIFDDV
jgi:hypothetical protein